MDLRTFIQEAQQNMHKLLFKNCKTYTCAVYNSTIYNVRMCSTIHTCVAYSTHVQDFESDSELKRGVKELLEDMMCSPSVMPSEQKAAASILNVLMKEADQMQVQLDQLLTPPLVSDFHCNL